MQRQTYDVVILGGGNAGFGATGPTRDAGFKVGLVEMRDLGGTCPNRGCVPKLEAAARLQRVSDVSLADHVQLS